MESRELYNGQSASNEGHAFAAKWVLAACRQAIISYDE